MNDIANKKTQTTLYLHPAHLNAIDDAIMRIHPADRPSRNRFILDAALEAARSTKKLVKPYR